MEKEKEATYNITCAFQYSHLSQDKKNYGIYKYWNLVSHIPVDTWLQSISTNWVQKEQILKMSANSDFDAGIRSDLGVCVITVNAAIALPANSAMIAKSLRILLMAISSNCLVSQIVIQRKSYTISRVPAQDITQAQEYACCQVRYAGTQIEEESGHSYDDINFVVLYKHKPLPFNVENIHKTLLRNEYEFIHF